jgi:hypothetical protein
MFSPGNDGLFTNHCRFHFLHRCGGIVPSSNHEATTGMSNGVSADTQPNGEDQAQGIIIGIGIGIGIVTIALILIAVVLAINAPGSIPIVQVIRDLVVIVLALELIITLTALVVLSVQVARFVNLLSNEFKPIIHSTTDTINTVRGTARFISKNLTEPVMNANSTLRGIGKALRDVNAIRKAASAAAAAASAMSPTGTRTTADSTPDESPPVKGGETTQGKEKGPDAQDPGKGMRYYTIKGDN